MSKTGRWFHEHQEKQAEEYASSPQGLLDQMEENFQRIFAVKQAKLEKVSNRLAKLNPNMKGGVKNGK